MLTTIQCMKSMANEGLVLNTFRQWNRFDKDYKWTIQGHVGSNCAANPDNQRSILGMQVFLNRSTVMAKNSTQRVVTLSAKEAELYTATSCAQDMLFVW